MQEYVNNALSTQQELQGIGASVENKFLGIIMLAGLPERFKPLVMTLEHAKTAITSENVVTALLKEDNRVTPTSSTQLCLQATQPGPSVLHVKPQKLSFFVNIVKI